METSSSSLCNQPEGQLSASLSEQQAEILDTSKAFGSEVDVISSIKLLSERLLESISALEKNSEKVHSQKSSDIELQQLSQDSSSETKLPEAFYNTQNQVENLTHQISDPITIVQNTDEHAASIYSDYTPVGQIIPESVAYRQFESESSVQSTDENPSPQYSESIPVVGALSEVINFQQSGSASNVQNSDEDVQPFGSTLTVFNTNKNAVSQQVEAVLCSQGLAAPPPLERSNSELSSSISTEHFVTQESSTELEVQRDIEYEEDNDDDFNFMSVQRKRKREDSSTFEGSQELDSEDDDPERLFLLSMMPAMKKIRRDRLHEVKLKIFHLIRKYWSD